MSAVASVSEASPVRPYSISLRFWRQPSRTSASLWCSAPRICGRALRVRVWASWPLAGR